MNETNNLIGYFNLKKTFTEKLVRTFACIARTACRNGRSKEWSWPSCNALAFQESWRDVGEQYANEFIGELHNDFRERWLKELLYQLIDVEHQSHDDIGERCARKALTRKDGQPIMDGCIEEKKTLNRCFDGCFSSGRTKSSK